MSYAPKTPGLAASKTGVKPRHKGKKPPFGVKQGGAYSSTPGAAKKAHRKGPRRPDDSSSVGGERRSYDRGSDRAPRSFEGNSDRAPRSFDNNSERPARRPRHEQVAREERREDSRDDRGGYARRDDRGSDRGGYARRDDRPYGDRRNDGGNDRRNDFRGSDDRPARRFDDRDSRGTADRDSRGTSDRDSRGTSDRGGFRRDNSNAGRSTFGDRRNDSGDRNRRTEWSDRGASDSRRGGSDDRRGNGEGRSGGSFERRSFDSDRPRHDRPARSFDRPSRDRSENKFEEGIDELTPIAGKAAVEVGENNAFAAMGLPDSLVAAVAASGIAAPFAIQVEAIPTALTGADILARAATGSGKTLAFGLPLIASLTDVKREPGRPHALVLVPTRELAMQVTEALAPLGKSVGLRMVLIAGGMPYKKQLMALEGGVDVLVATPGRLIDLIERGAADLSAVRVSVLDEADQMCDMGFAPEVTRILGETPSDSQRMLFSATLDGDVDKLVKKFLTNPVRHSTADVKATIDLMEHHVFVVHPGRKAEVTAELASREGRTIVFVRTKLGADRVAEKLRDAGVGAAALHGGLNQGARTRTLSAFREGHVPVLVATDVAARGIHIDDVGLIVQADPPTDHKTYLHRAGRTARAGGSGSVVTLAMPRERGGVERTTRMAGVNVRGVYVEPGDTPLEDITGGTKPSGIPVAEYRAPAPARSSRGPRRDFNGGRGRSYGRRPQRSY